VHPIAALQTEYSLLHREPEREIVPVLRELGIAFVAYSPLGRGLLAGRIRRPDDLSEEDWRRGLPRFQGENLERNVALLAALDGIADARGVSPATIAIAWVLGRGDEVIPLVGTSRADHVERNLDALEVDLDEDELAALDEGFPVGATAGDRYPPEMMGSLDR
jgi:aryl-alcohol dehydrogenase-like predicted oxidoreductase